MNKFTELLNKRDELFVSEVKKNPCLWSVEFLVSDGVTALSGASVKKAITFLSLISLPRDELKIAVSNQLLRLGELTDSEYKDIVLNAIALDNFELLELLLKSRPVNISEEEKRDIIYNLSHRLQLASIYVFNKYVGITKEHIFGLLNLFFEPNTERRDNPYPMVVLFLLAIKDFETNRIIDIEPFSAPDVIVNGKFLLDNRKFIKDIWKYITKTNKDNKYKKVRNLNNVVAIYDLFYPFLERKFLLSCFKKSLKARDVLNVLYYFKKFSIDDLEMTEFQKIEVLHSSIMNFFKKKKDVKLIDAFVKRTYFMLFGLSENGVYSELLNEGLDSYEKISDELERARAKDLILELYLFNIYKLKSTEVVDFVERYGLVFPLDWIEKLEKKNRRLSKKMDVMRKAGFYKDVSNSITNLSQKSSSKTKKI